MLLLKCLKRLEHHKHTKQVSMISLSEKTYIHYFAALIQNSSFDIIMRAPLLPSFLE